MIRMRPRWQMIYLTTLRAHKDWDRAVITKPLSANNITLTNLTNNRPSNRNRVLWWCPSSSSHLLHRKLHPLRCKTSFNHLRRSIKIRKSLRLLLRLECKISLNHRNRCKHNRNPKCLLPKTSKAAIRTCIRCSSTHLKVSSSQWLTRTRQAATTMIWAVAVAWQVPIPVVLTPQACLKVSSPVSV